MVLFALGLSAPCGAGTPKTISAHRIVVPPVLDGSLSDSVWSQVEPAADFMQFDPKEGEQPTESTAVRLLYDDRTLYVGVVCYDTDPEGIVRQLSRRDRSTEADRFTVMIDSYFDRRTAFVFSANVSGVQSDGVLSEDGAVYDLTWDAVWTVRTHLRTRHDGWSAEFAIPFNALRFVLPERGELRWGINFRRYISRKKETDEWVMVPRNEQGQVSRWGTVTALRGIRAPLRLEVLPYASVSTEVHTAVPGSPHASRTSTLAGIDLKYGLRRSFTLDATFNPDFGQVEVDQSVLNLTVFETRFPEKRPFFVEGAQMFTFGASYDNTPLALFFSRRIGRRPMGSGGVTAPAGGRIVDNPLLTTIIGAAKVTGRTTDGLTVAGLSAVTEREEATVADAAGRESRFRTEPRGVYSVLRLRQDFDGGSWLGGMATVASREGALPAMSGGIDWNVRFADGTHTADGYIAGARSTAGRRDGGGAGRLLLGRIAAEHWLYFASYNFATREFFIDDLGFFGQARDHGGYVQATYRENFAGGMIRRYALSLVPEARWNWNGAPTLRQAEFTATAELLNFWRLTLGYKQNFTAYDDEERGIIGLHRRPARGEAHLQVVTDQRQPVIATLATRYGRDSRRVWDWLGSLGLTVRPASWFELEPSATVETARGERVGVYSGGGIVSTTVNGTLASVFGDRDLDQFDLAIRGTLTFTRELSVQFFGQALLARGRYRSARALLGPAAFAPLPDPGTLYDFNAAALNANILLRWEFLPGSSAYLVWTQERMGDNGIYETAIGHRIGEAFALPHTDVLMVKVSYWLGF
jgi:hypothetical protein